MATKGSFEFIEEKIRSQAKGTEFGKDFEWLCKWYLENAPQYRGKFRKVYLWNDWPDRWGPDCGVDLIAETHSGDLWAIQSKAVSEDHTLTKREIDSFLAESSRKQIKYRLLIASTDKVGSNARRTIDQQEKQASLLLRGDLLTADLLWPDKVGGKAPKPVRAKPRPHQKAAINDVKRGFKKHSKGQLIMACGTGKTLTGLWIKEALKAQRTLLLVPSISLVQQNLSEWGRHSKQDFECLVVCSDETVKNDAAVHHVSELGIDVTTDPADIATFLKKKHKRPVVVISTYHSSDRVSEGQLQAKRWFDLTICDEAHRLTGDINSTFATALDEEKIKSKKRLFMTATPRRLTERVKSRLEEEQLEAASMDDVETFGPEFHKLSFRDAIEAKPEPLLTKYQVVIVDVTNKEVQQLVRNARLVRTKEGVETDAKKLASQIGLAKAIKQYSLEKVITFHRTVAGARNFVDKDRTDSLPVVLSHLDKKQKLWARHISGMTPASTRRSLLNGLGDQPSGTTAIVSNCSCLNEGVDVPALDGIAFIDPRSSEIDIIQAVGRVIRKSPTKQVGTIVIPVFVNEDEDAEKVLSSSKYKHIYRVIRALRSHDDVFAAELDQIRLSMERNGGGESGSEIKLPSNIHIDFQVNIKDFAREFAIRTVMMTTERSKLTIEQILEWADIYNEQHSEYPTARSGNVEGTSENWCAISAALTVGTRGLPGGSSLARLLQEHRGINNHLNQPDLTIDQILIWVDVFIKRRSEKPNQRSGKVEGTSETWGAIDLALRDGRRGLLGGSSLARLLQEHRGINNRSNQPDLSEEQILEWVDAFIKKHGKRPTTASGNVEGTSETWRQINESLSVGIRGLPGGSSLARLLQEHRGINNHLNQPDLSEEQILEWVDAFIKKHGKHPTTASGNVEGASETWGAINNSLSDGRRGLPGGSSLARLLQEHRGIKNHLNQPDLSKEQILKWADAFTRKHNKHPVTKSGKVEGTSETWGAINNSLSDGRRGLPGGSSLARLLQEHRGINNQSNQPDLSEQQILEWVDAYFNKHGKRPTEDSGNVEGTSETWGAINASLRRGYRGLPGGSSLYTLLKAERPEYYKQPASICA